jgi:hypothetical protein
MVQGVVEAREHTASQQKGAPVSLIYFFSLKSKTNPHIFRFVSHIYIFFASKRKTQQRVTALKKLIVFFSESAGLLVDSAMYRT